MYIVVETFPVENSAVVIDPETGTVLTFAKKEDAEIEAANCQRGVVISV